MTPGERSAKARLTAARELIVELTAQQPHVIESFRRCAATSPVPVPTVMATYTQVADKAAEALWLPHRRDLLRADRPLPLRHDTELLARLPRPLFGASSLLRFLHVRWYEVLCWYEVLLRTRAADGSIARADVQLAFPFILLAITIAGVLGPSPRNVILILGIGGWVVYARLARGQVLSLREKEFIEAVRGPGGGASRRGQRHAHAELGRDPGLHHGRLVAHHGSRRRHHAHRARHQFRGRLAPRHARPRLQSV